MDCTFCQYFCVVQHGRDIAVFVTAAKKNDLGLCDQDCIRICGGQFPVQCPHNLGSCPKGRISASGDAQALGQSDHCHAQPPRRAAGSELVSIVKSLVSDRFPCCVEALGQANAGIRFDS